MAGPFDFITDLFGQTQEVPQQTIIPTSELLNQTYGQLGSALPGQLAYDQRLALGNAGNQLAYEGAINPFAAPVRTGAYKSILDNLNLGYSVPQDLQDLITTNTLQSNSMSGLGASQAGDLFGSRSLLSAGLNLQRQRQQDALDASRGLALTGAGFTPTPSINAGAVAQDIRGAQAATDEAANIARDTELQNKNQAFKSLLRIAGAAIGGVGGYFAGNPLGGAQTGAAIGETSAGGSRVAGMSPVSTPGINPQSGSGFGLGGILSIFH